MPRSCRLAPAPPTASGTHELEVERASDQRGLVVGAKGRYRERLDRRRYGIDDHVADRDDRGALRTGERRDQFGESDGDRGGRDAGERSEPPSPAVHNCHSPKCHREYAAHKPRKRSLRIFSDPP